MIKQNFNKDWEFHENSGCSVSAPMAGEGEKQMLLVLPHDASITKSRNPIEPGGSGNGFFREEACHYTKTFFMAKENDKKSVWLEFEGVYQNAFIYINNAFAGKHPYGYGNFYIDATQYLDYGKNNTIKIVVKNGMPSGRWYTGSGIYRDVHIMIADRLHIEPDGVRLTVVEKEKDCIVIEVDTALSYSGIGVRRVEIKTELFDADEKLVAEDILPITVFEGMNDRYRQRIYVQNPNLWDVESPYLYKYKVSVVEDGKVVDEEYGTYGIRTLSLSPKYGFCLNGKTIKLRGGCIHHDNGIIGAMEFPHAAYTRISKIKEAGYNAVRSAHYPMSRHLLNACDQLGMLVMDELTDVWNVTKVDGDYGMSFSEWWEQDIANMVRKDYNHPCVIMYSIGNEIAEVANRADVQWGRKLADKIRSLDRSRYVTNGINMLLCILPQLNTFIDNETTSNGVMEINSTMNNLGEMMDQILASDRIGKLMEEAFSQLDIAGYNYGTGRYGLDTELYPNRIIVGAETYIRDLAVNWEQVEKYPNVIGDFAWTAYDYLGEAGIGKIDYGEPKGFDFYAAYPYKAAYCGDINLIGDRRPSSFWREIIWGIRKNPYLAVRPPKHYGEQLSVSSWGMTDAIRSWNWEGAEGKPVIVEVYSCEDEVELFINGISAGRKKTGETMKGITLFDTFYQKGEVVVISYHNGIEKGRDSIITAEEDVLIEATADKCEIPADGSDICFVEIKAVDSYGRLNPQATFPVSVSANGSGEILGYGSGAPDSEENYFDLTARLYEGRLRAAIRANGSRGTINLAISYNSEITMINIEAV